MNEFERLKQLILSDELQSVRHIEVELRRLQNTLDHPEALVQHITPHFSKMLVNASSQERDAFETAVIHALNSLIEHGSQRSYASVIENISPLIYKELCRYTASHKDQVSDLLYPVVGGMITKYPKPLLTGETK